MKTLTDHDIERHIRDSFEMNYEILRLEGGHAISPSIKEIALQQVLLYWKKLRDVAENVTDTEVELSLPEQRSPKGRRFCVEGIVDIVKEEGETWMYDIKTHDADYVRANKDLYEKQLDVYAHIWQKLRGQQLDHTAIIATSLSDGLNRAIREKDQKRIEEELARWEPLIEIPYDQLHVNETIEAFGKVVDCIEENRFDPPSHSVLKSKLPGDNQMFVTRVCRNCDARFSCQPYREIGMSGRDKGAAGYRKYINDFGDDIEGEDWKTVNLENARMPDLGQTLE